GKACQLGLDPNRVFTHAAPFPKNQERDMGKWWKVAGGTLAGIAALAAAGVFAGLQLAERKQARKVEVKVQALAVSADAAALERGRYLFTSRGCVDCHGANGAG